MFPTLQRLVLALLMGGIPVGCGQSVPAEALEEMRNYYRTAEIRGKVGAWRAEVVTISGSGIHVRMGIPPERAKEVSAMLGASEETSQKGMVARTACPPEGHKIWSLLGGSADVEISVRARGATGICSTGSAAGNSGRRAEPLNFRFPLAIQNPD